MGRGGLAVGGPPPAHTSSASRLRQICDSTSGPAAGDGFPIGVGNDGKGGGDGFTSRRIFDRVIGPAILEFTLTPALSPQGRGGRNPPQTPRGATPFPRDGFTS